MIALLLARGRRATRALGLAFALVMTLGARAQLAPVALKDDGFLDVDIPLATSRVAQDGTKSYDARGQYDGKVVGFGLDVLPGWRASEQANPRFNFYWGKVRLRSLGAPSNAFLHLVATRYGIQGQAPMASELVLQAVCLGCNPDAATSAPLRMKAFIQGSGKDDEYAEVFMNVEPVARRLEFHEKDPEYRVPLVKGLESRR